MKDPLLRPVKPIKHRRIKKTLSEEVKNTYRSLLATLIILGIGSTGIYLYTNSLKPAKGYELKGLQTSYEELQSEQRKLNQKVIEAQSFLLIAKSDHIESMQSIDNQPISYLDESNVASTGTNSGTDWPTP